MQDSEREQAARCQKRCRATIERALEIAAGIARQLPGARPLRLADSADAGAPPEIETGQFDRVWSKSYVETVVTLTIQIAEALRDL